MGSSIQSTAPQPDAAPDDEAGPHANAGLAAASIFTFRIACNEFIPAPVLTDRQTRTLPVAASLFITGLTAGAVNG